MTGNRLSWLGPCMFFSRERAHRHKDKAMARKHRACGGYTLLELLLTLAVLGVVLAAGIPYLGGYMRSRSVGDCVASMASRFDLARSRAVAERNPYLVFLDNPSAGQYEIVDDDNRNGQFDTGEAVLGPYSLPPRIQFASIQLLGNGGIAFLPSGMLQAGQGGTITLGDDQGRRATLEVFTSGLTRIRAGS